MSMIGLRQALICLALLSQPAAAQDDLHYQPLEIRHVCAGASVFADAGRGVVGTLDAGTEVRVTGFTFSADVMPYFAVDYASGSGLQRAAGFVAMEDVRSFCPAPVRTPYRAPPNTCHLTAGWRSSIGEVNDLAVGLRDFGPSMSAYRVRGGGYTLSLGLLNIRASAGILRGSQVLPDESDCVSGETFVSALVQTGDGFAAAGAREEVADAKAACDLGQASACTDYAAAMFDGSLPEVVTHYGLLGCMAGDPVGCKLAINRQDNTLENAQFRAIEVGTTDHLPLVGPELARLVCDTGDSVGCILMARASATDGSGAAVASGFAEKLTACQTGGGWMCLDLIDDFQPVYQARGEGAFPSADENYALAALWEELCTPGARGPDVQRCDPAYLRYASFLRYGGDDMRATTAKSLLERGCEAGDPRACAEQTTLADHWSTPVRNAAAARAVALCGAQVEKDSVCGNLGIALDPALPEAGPAVGIEYERLALICRTDVTTQGPQACSAALFAYANLQADDGLDTAEAMLREACSGPITNGCGVLGFLYGKGTQTSGGIIIAAMDRPEARLAALRTGCVVGSDTCLTLALALADGGDTDQAMQTYARSCDTQIRMAQGRPDNVRACYEAASFALDRQMRYPDALRWSRFACEGGDIGLSPYGCKLQGNILARGLGAEAEPEQAMAAYRDGCFHPFVSTTDGESCLNYGNIVVDEMPSEASRAYDMGCLDGIPQACEANRVLLEDWSAGLYPYDTYRCWIENDAGQVASDKTCRRFAFYQGEDRDQIPRDIYVWPDGDRTVTYAKGGTWFLNEVVTAGIRREGDRSCWRNPVSTRTFCVAQLR